MSIRLTYLLGLIIVSSILVTSLYFQFFDGIMPCPLCTLQRFTFGIIGILCILGFFLYRKRNSRFVINGLCGLFSIVGMLLAGRQVWLQHFPSADNSECGVSLQYMLQVLPMNQALQKIFEGSAECTQRGWEFLHLNMAEWALIWFVLFFLFSICLYLEELKWKR